MTEPVTAPVTVGDLITALSQLPPDTQVLVDGYEAGFTGIGAVQQHELQQLDGLPDWMGRYLHPADVDRELAGAGESGWQATTGGTPPVPVGVPVTVVVLHRQAAANRRRPPRPRRSCR